MSPRLSLAAALLALGMGGCSASEEQSATTGQDLAPSTGVEAPAAPVPAESLDPARAGLCSDPIVTPRGCSASPGYTVLTRRLSEAPGPELVLLGLYGPASEREAQPVRVADNRLAPHTLVLFAHEPVRWAVEAARGVRIERIILAGARGQGVASAPEGVPVENRSDLAASVALCAAQPADPRCDMAGLATRTGSSAPASVVAFAGCLRPSGFVIDNGPNTCPPPPPPPTRPGQVRHTVACTAGQGQLTTYVSPTPGEPELHLLGVYETHSNHSGGNHPEGSATVAITRQARMILTLSSYEPVHWQVRAAPGARIERIILNGYHPQRVTAPAGIPVDNRSGYQRWLGSCTYAWPSSTGGCETRTVVSSLERLTSRPLTSFAGCYQATSFALE
jgi:hypothetical protein